MGFSDFLVGRFCDIAGCASWRWGLGFSDNWGREFSEGWSVSSTRDAVKGRGCCSQCFALVMGLDSGIGSGGTEIPEYSLSNLLLHNENKLVSIYSMY